MPQRGCRHIAICNITLGRADLWKCCRTTDKVDLAWSIQAYRQHRCCSRRCKLYQVICWLKGLGPQVCACKRCSNAGNSCGHILTAYKLRVWRHSLFRLPPVGPCCQQLATAMTVPQHGLQHLSHLLGKNNAQSCRASLTLSACTCVRQLRQYESP